MCIPRLTLRSPALRSALLAILLCLVAGTNSLTFHLASSQSAATPLRLAASGELGSTGPNEAKGADLVNRWRPDFIHTINAADLLTTTAPAATMDAGYEDFTFHPDCTSAPTGEKPESKLWFTDGVWWASMCTSATPAYHIYRLDRPSNAWIDTGTVLDDRGGSKADVLWEEATQTLYVASHIFTTLAEPAPAENLWGRLYRYHYNTADQTYVLDPGFPVTITRGKSETLTLAKDTTGKLWITYVESSQVMVNHSSGGGLEFDQSWGAPYSLPVSGAANLSSDDITTLIAYADRIGIMWSNQTTQRLYFAGHQDSEVDDQTWQAVSMYRPGGLAADDHLNLKSLQSDGAGHLYAVTKSNFTEASQPLIALHACGSLPCLTARAWTAHPVFTVAEDNTRPLLLIDTDNQKLYVFAADHGMGGGIYYKSAAIANIQFPAGEGIPFIERAADEEINNATSTKQNVNRSTGLVVLAASHTSRAYYHNCLSLTEPETACDDTSATATSTPPTGTPTVAPTDTATPVSTPTPTPTRNEMATSTPTPTFGTPGSERTYHQFLPLIRN